MNMHQKTTAYASFFEVVIYRCKKQWSVIIFMTKPNYLGIDTSKRKWAWCKTMKIYSFINMLKYLWIDTNKHEWAWCKTMKSWRFSLQYSSQILYSLYIPSIYVGVWCTFFVHSLSHKILICTIFLYKIYAKLVFCIIFVFILYSFPTQ